MEFADLGLHDTLLGAIVEAGYPQPTPVQQQAVPAALAGRDLMVSSQTGSGKTAAFMWPALNRLTADSAVKARGPRVLVLTPTRELAIQVTDACRKYGRGLRYAKAVSVVGGTSYVMQNKLLAQPYEVLVATPGRLIDQMDSGRIDFGRLEMLVLDEADRMLDMGFIEDIEAIVDRLPDNRQTLLFSATFEPRIMRLAERLTKDAQRIEIQAAANRHENIDQRLMFADGLSHKQRLLDHLLRGEDVEQAIVFTATKRDADQLAETLGENGFLAAALHGDMHQGERNRTLGHLRRGALRVLVATDVAARGIDVAGISHVINFDLPKSAEDYVHRIGRTGRAGRSGVAVSLASGDDVRRVKTIERFIRHTIPVHTIPGLEPRVQPRTSAPRGPRTGAGRPGGWGSKPGNGPRRPGGGAPRSDGGWRGNGGGRSDRGRRAD
ncbi:DEAD/DEAH box helicase [Methyloversatilis thermotolerans]|uniref:DEAD/DEAH box helicase n=1 Tax=Methyloversatilis thermotolerans TaxID=1346290 RepID=UPI0003772E83|nr:DEAD/DEAH box helicase [Methyloversatilis thermotolerans]